VDELEEGERYYVEYDTNGNLTYYEQYTTFIHNRLLEPVGAEEINILTVRVNFSDRLTPYTAEQVAEVEANAKLYLENHLINYAVWNHALDIEVTIDMLSTEQCDRTNNDTTEKVRDLVLAQVEAMGLVLDDYELTSFYLPPNNSCGLGQATTGRSRPRYNWLYTLALGTNIHEKLHTVGPQHPANGDPVNIMRQAGGSQKPITFTDLLDQDVAYGVIANPIVDGSPQGVSGIYEIVPTQWLRNHKWVNDEKIPLAKGLIVHEPNKRALGSIPARDFKDMSIHFSYNMAGFPFNVDISDGLMIRRTRWSIYNSPSRVLTYIDTLQVGETYQGDGFTATLLEIDDVRVCAYIDIQFEEI